ncbi:MAG TPA: TonB-dependent receptor [Verrucomicrobiae bacterium]|nr:TonB-dependent receptor [Verrucomicrobiae bacterium]
MQKRLIGTVLRAALDPTGAGSFLIQWRTRSGACMALLVLMLIGAVNAQQSGITGSVTDSTGRVIAGADVEAQISGGVTFHTTSDAAGIFQFPNIMAANYTVRVERTGFTTITEKLNVLVGNTATLNVMLPVAGATSAVIVTTKVNAIDTSTSQIAGNIDPETMASIPLNGRNYMDLATLLPGIRRNAITNFSPLGMLSKGREQFNLDNQQVTATGAATDYGQAQFSRDALSQFAITTDQFDATQGRSSQLVMNMQSMAGKNTMHGSVFGYFRNSVFDAADPITKTVLPFSDQQYGGTLGGAIRKDRLWYFASYEGEHRPETTNTQFVGFIVPPLAYSLSNTLTTEKSLDRIDFQPRARDHIFGRYFRYDFSQPALLPSGNSSLSREYSVSGSDYGFIGAWTRNISSTIVNTLFGSTFFQAGVDEPALRSMQITFPSQIIGAAYNFPSYLPVRYFQFRDDAYWLKGKHSVRFGAEYLFDPIRGSFPQNVQGAATVKADPPNWVTPMTWDEVFPNQLDPSTWNYAAISPNVSAYTQGFGNFNTNINSNIIGLWAQDDWRMFPRLTANLGLRYDNNIGLITAGNNTINGVVSAQHGNNWNFGPRLGFAYDALGTGKTVFRGGTGIYFADLLANAFFDDEIFNGVNSVQAAAAIKTGFSLTDPFPGQNTSSFVQDPQNVYQSIQVTGQKIRTPWSVQGSLGFQQQLTPTTTVSLDFVQLRVFHDWTRFDANTAYDPSTGWNQTNIGPVSAPCPNGCITSRLQPNSHYAVIATAMTPGYVGSAMKNILFGLRQQTKFGLSGMMSYTYGLEKDNSADAFAYASNPYNYANEWANSVDDQRHTLAVTADYRWKRGWGGGVVYHYGSGLAYATTVGGSTPTGLVASATYNRSYCAKPADYISGALPGSICSHVSTADYLAMVYNDPRHDHYDPNTGLTTVDRNSLRGLPVERFDADLTKVFTVHERFKITSAVEAFNLLNHANYGSYNGVISLPSYRSPTFTSGVLAFFARQLQFSARLDF